MNITTTTLALILTVAFSFSAQAQNKQRERLSFNYIQPGSSPIKGVTTFKTVINMSYEEAILKEKAQAQIEYEEAVKNYPAILQLAKEKHDSLVKSYEDELADWNSKSGAGKMISKKIMEESKPRHPGNFYAPSQPYLRKVDHQIIFDREELIKEHIRINGKEEGTENVIEITLDMNGFEFKDAQTLTTTSSDKAAHYYMVEVKHKMNIKVVSPDGTILMNEEVNGSDKYRTYKSTTFIDGKGGPSLKGYTDGLQSEIAEKHFETIHELINDKYGELTKKRDVIVYSYKSNKVDYSDLDKAVVFAKMGYENLMSNSKSSIENINNAIAIWDKALTESDPENKKARINNKVSIDIYKNIIEAYIWLKKFDVAETYIEKMQNMDIDNGDSKDIKELREFFNELKLRQEANQ